MATQRSAAARRARAARRRPAPARAASRPASPRSRPPPPAIRARNGRRWTASRRCAPERLGREQQRRARRARAAATASRRRRARAPAIAQSGALAGRRITQATTRQKSRSGGTSAAVGPERDQRRLAPRRSRARASSAVSTRAGRRARPAHSRGLHGGRRRARPPSTGPISSPGPSIGASAAPGAHHPHEVEPAVVGGEPHPLPAVRAERRPGRSGCRADRARRRRS